MPNNATNSDCGFCRVSILLPVRSDSEFVREAIDSILAQSYRNFEVLVLADPASDAPTLDIIRAYSDSRIRLLVSKELKTVGGILNFGMALATGEYIARMDADDIAFPARLEEQVRYLDENSKVAICGTWCELFGSECWEFRPPSTDEELRAGLIFGCVFLHPSVMWRSQEFATHQLTYDDTLRATEDYDLWVRAAERVRFGCVPQKLLLYRKHAKSATQQREAEGKATYRQLLDNSLRKNGYSFDQEDLDFHYRYVTSGLENDGEIYQLRYWLHRLWLSDLNGQTKERRQAIGNLCARRWFDACSSLQTTAKYSILRSSGLCSLLPPEQIEDFRRHTN